MKIIVSLLICFLFAFAAASNSQALSSSIQLDVFSGSNAWWLAFAVRNAGVDTSSVQIKEASSSSWESMDYSSGWGYYTLSSNDRMAYPISVRLVSAEGEQVTIVDGITSFSVGTVNTGVTYGSSGPTATPATHKQATTKPTTKPGKAATAAPTTKPGKAATAAPTTKPGKAATAAPTSKAATTKPSSGSGSSGLKLLVPLYEYPGSGWDAVAAGGSSVSTVAIINPNSGPGTGPDSTYNTYMTKLHNAGVEMIGYVHTSYGARSIADVKADIDIYAASFPLLVGIFLDEAAATASEVAYYQQLYTYIMNMPGWKYDVINPGTVPTSGYASVATTIVSYENTISGFSSSANPSFAASSNKDLFAVIAYAGSSSTMQTAVTSAVSKGYYGWVYFTDGASGCCTYNSLASYYSTMVSYVASKN